MAVNTCSRWNRTHDLCLSVIYILALIQLTFGLALPRINVPSNALPGYKLTEIQKDGQSSELVSDSDDIHKLFQLAENGALKIKNSLKHLANSDIALKIRHTLKDHTWDDLLDLHVQDSSLEFSKKSYRGYVFESHEAQQEVMGLDDLQVASTKPVSYQLAGMDSDKFRLEVNPEGQVQIFTTAPVDSQTTSQYHVEIIASSEDLQKATAEIIIDVSTGNNQAPTFVMDSFVSSTYTDAPVGTRVVTVHASDGDAGENGQISYSMESPSDVFSLDPKTGVITVSSPPITKDYTFVVRAQDHGNPPLVSLPAEVTVIVRPLSNNFRPLGDDIMYPPDDEPVKMVRVRREVLPGESVNLPESAEVGSVVHTITVTGTDLRYAMGTPANDKFSIDEMTGDITLLQSVDFEAGTNLQEIVNVEITNTSDADVLDTLVVTFDIRDADDPPVWTMPVYPYIAVVPTDAPNQACIYTLQAEDQDVNTVITYSLFAGGGGAFSVGETNGCVYTVVTDDSPPYVQDEEYVLSVMATGTSPDFVGEVSGVIRIYGGSYPPQFTQEEYSASVLEAQSNQVVTQVQASSFSRNVAVTYAIVGPDNRPDHTINEADGTITLIQEVLVEDTPSYFLIVRATEQGGDDLTSDVRVNVMVEDINNCEPTFGQDIISFNDVPETTAIGDPVGTVTATDCDVGVNAELTYSIVTPNSDFTIGSATGVISPAVVLDYEEGERYYTFVVMATDGGAPAMSSTATVVISIADGPEAPYFTPSSYSFRMDETAEVNYEVGTVYASDDDVGDTVTLSIVGGDGTFTIDQSGVISVARGVTESSYTFDVLARDAGGNETTAAVEIAVTDLNDNIPQFANCGSYEGQVSEDADIDTEVITVTAEDADQGSNAEIRYALSSNEEANRFFQIDQNGVISTNSLLDRETIPSFLVTVEAIDDGTPSLTGFCTFTISITDVNDNRPSFPFTRYQTSISTAAEDLDVVITVQADDLDTGGVDDLDYTLGEETTGSCDTSYFTINPRTGQILVRQNLTNLIETGREEQDCRVTATDGGGLSTDVPVQIDVRSIDDTTYRVPTFTSTEYEVNIPEDSMSQQVLLVSVTGTDQVGFNIIRGARPSTNSNQNFGLSQGDDQRTSSYITVLGALDYESVQRYTLLVTAKYPDPLLPYTSQTNVLINVEDVNDEAPLFPASTFFGNIAENQPAGTPVITMQATDADVTLAFNQITYTIEGNQTDFSIDETTGVITSLTEFDREAVADPTIALTVRASDGLNYNDATVFVTIVDENDNQPEFDGTFSFSIAEDAQMGAVVGRVTATDADISEVLEYFISGGNDGGAFTVDANSGIIRKAGVLDYETQTSYDLEYSVNDGKNTETTIVVVNITNVNDVAPQFGESSYSATVTEEDDTNLPRILLTVAATDGDAGADSNAIRYGLLGTGAGSLFVIDPDTGNITLTGVLDREEIPRYVLSAMATDDDGNGLSSYVDVIIDVEDINDNAPSFPEQEYVGSVDENMIGGTPVITVAAEDPDSGDTLTYSLIPADDANFQINPATGEITTRRQLDRETPPAEFQLQVQVTDGENTASTPVTIIVNDVDDTRPTFTEDTYPDAFVSESAPEGETVAIVQAIDPDVDFMDTVLFTIVSGDSNDLFRIVSDPATLSGVIQVNQPLDFESDDSFLLTIQVEDSQPPTDSGRPDTATIQIFVENANDIAPVFDTDTYQGSVLEDASDGTRVGDFTLSATDGDSPDNDLTYEIDPTTDPEGQFAIVNQELVVASALDKETQEFYTLTVYAVDNGVPPLSGTATVSVTVLDVNEPPVFAEDYAPSVVENSVAVLDVVNVMGKDLDEPPAGPPFIYNVATPREEWATYFSIEGLGTSTSDVINIRTTGTPIDREEIPYFDIVFLIEEVTTPELLTGTQTLTIMVTDVNDNPHVGVTKNILVYSYEGALPEVSLGEIPTTQVGQVEVEDPDILDDKTYSVVGEFPENFELDTDTGDITMNEGTPEGVYTLTVLVSDGKEFPDVESTVIVTVKEIPQEAVFSSGSIRFSDTTAEELIDPDETGVSTLDRLKVILANAVGAQLENLDIFSVLNVEGMERTVDIRYAAHGSPYYPADRLDLAALSVEDDIAALGLNIAQLPVDLCIQESVCESSCTNVLVVDPTPTVVDSGGASFVAVTSVLQAQCVCGARTEAPGTCDSAPCLNGGTCVDVHGGTYRCECPYLYDGPNCQETKRSFNDGYATFSTLRQCEETSLSIEFITENPSGTLFYNGPIQTLGPDDPMDLILLELTGGKAMLTINLGSRNDTVDYLVLEVPKDDLADGQWHRIDVYRNGRFVEMTVDRCEDAAFVETSRASDLDTSSCRSSGETPGENKFLNVNTPLFLGGMSSEYTTPITVPGGFDGCIKNLVSDGFLYDLADPGRFDKSDPGCLRTDGQCTVDGQPVCENGICEADLDSYVCICYPGFSGDTCGIVLPPYDFATDSYITYQLLDASLYDDARSSNYQIMVRTRQQDGLIWSISSANTYEYIRMAMVEGELQADWHLGDKPVTVTMQNFSLNDGAWHAINFDRYDSVVTIKIDGGGGVKEIQNRESDFSGLVVDENSLIIGASVDVSAVTDDFMGCMNDPRINNNFLGMDGSNDFAIATKSAGVTEGCPSDVCDSNPCPGEDLVCVDYWRLYECECPVGEVLTAPETCSAIVDCDPNPCLNGGTCTEGIPTGFNCTCAPTYYGETCEATFGEQGANLGITTLGILLMILCILLIIILLLGLILYTRQRDRKSALAFAVDPEDDIRENFINYDEEGGGEEDNDAYDLSTLRKPVDAISAGSLEKKPIEPVSEVPVGSRQPGVDPNVGDFINDRLKGANDDPDGPPYDEPHIYDYEGDGSTAGSLSSLNSSSTESEQNYDYLNDWGPQFRKLADMYGS